MDDFAMDQPGDAPRTRLAAAARSLGGVAPADEARYAAFLDAYFQSASDDALARRSPAQLAAIALAHWRLAQRRAPGETLLRLRAPEPGGPLLATVETCVADQPFLVDTLLIALRGAGAAVDWFVHPLIAIGRGGDGGIVAIGGAAPLESLIHIAFEMPAGAAVAQLEAALRSALGDLRAVVDDYPAALARVRALADALAAPPPGADADEYAEARAFLGYLHDRHYTFLAVQETRAERGADQRLRFVPQAETGLGLLRAGSRWAAQALIAPPAELDRYAESPRLVVITKAALRSTVHRAEAMDVVSVKRFDAAGALLGTTRLVGLFSSEVYIDRPRDIPLIRRKAAQVMARARLPESSHAGKQLRDILHGLPRDELFQSGEDELFALCMGVLGLREHGGLRLFLRRDRYGRFYSALLYLPRERYSRELRDRAGSVLMDCCGGLALDRSTEFPRGDFARIHYLVRTPPGARLALGVAEIERRMIAATRGWRDELRALLQAQPDGVPLAARFADAFPAAYRERVAPAEALADVRALARLDAAQPLLVRLALAETGDGHADGGASGGARAVALTLFVLGEPLALSDVLPALENFGLRVIRQEPAELRGQGGPALWVQRFEVAHPGSRLAADAQRARFEPAFVDVCRGTLENDGLNRLVLGAGLDARQVTLLRALVRYLLQTALPFGQTYIETLLAAHAAIAAQLVRLFETRFDPALTAEARSRGELAQAQAIEQALDGVASLDADRLLRALLAVIRAGLRSNAWQREADGSPRRTLALKLDPAKIAELPLPRPMFEIWVCAPEVEGVHLRGGRVARGGLRWSDRRQDFRTEVLGLMKAQMVKNTVIVPVGAKGGFVVRRPVDAANPDGGREAWLAQGQDCYRRYLRALLDVTDNRAGDAIVPPQDVVRHDGDDPYLVVAADKGTASFSDIANAVAAEYGFWLGDAFASGGSAGYDHKAMGITARGAWESVKRHFRELPGAQGRGIDIQNEPFTCVGIGDMSGDVFGNGMLLSKTMRLLAAFDHRHIFLDPDPDAAASHAERERLFRLPRSSWADYDAALISRGGGVFPRSAKLIAPSAEIRARLSIAAEKLTPNELIGAILRAPVDLLWNGGIGTYVKASAQSHADAGDRSNDAVRVDGRELRCRVVGEGGNLGFTQAARIEYALHGCGGAGGRINTDAIDNAGGVHTSDREVNIKIALNEAMAEGALTRAGRDPLLAAATGDIAAFVLRDNYVQSAAISLLAHDAAARLDDHAELIRMLEREGRLDRALEGLPDEDQLQERRARGLGLTRPELAVLIAYSKISLTDAILKSEVPDDPAFTPHLLANFPAALVARFRERFERHRLRREIIATILANAIVNRMGAGFAQLWADDHGLGRAAVIKGYATAHEVLDGDGWWRAIEALDLQVPAALQLRLMAAPVGLLKHAAGWFAASRWARRPVGEAVAHFAAPVAGLARLLPALLTPSYREDWSQAVAAMIAEGTPSALAERLASARALGAAFDIAELAENAGVPLAFAAEAYFALGERLGMPWLHAAINELATRGKWASLARVQLRDDAWRNHRRIAAAALAQPGADAASRVAHWLAHAARATGFERLAEIRAAGGRDHAALAVAVRELAAGA